MSWTPKSASAPRLGERFELISNVDRQPHFTAPKGSRGEVTDVSGGAVCLRLDEVIRGAEEWDNEAVWDHNRDQDFWADVAVEGER